MDKYISENKFFYFDRPKRKNIMYFAKEFVKKLIIYLYQFILLFWHPYKVTNKKYNISICAIFKNEAKYLKEWIEYHRIIGINHFYMYNNNSDDNYLEVLGKYIDEGIVDLIQWPKNQAQMEAYEDCIRKHKQDTNWIAFIDIDEFINPIRDNNISEFLNKRIKRCGSVLLYWKMFNTSGRIYRETDKLVTEDFVVCWDKYKDVGKCIYNTAYEYPFSSNKNKILHHYLWTKYKGLLIPPINAYGKIGKKINDKKIIQINHYFTKSYEEYYMKKIKGDVYSVINPHDEEYFFEHEMKPCSTDYTIYKYLVKLKLALKEDK